MERICTASGVNYTITEEDLSCYDRLGPVIGRKHFVLPPPKLCPTERFRRRLSFRNERHLYKRQCAVSGKPIVSIYSPDKELRVCDREHWAGLDNRQYGRDFDFSRPFFPQFSELYRQTCKANVIQTGEMLNSEYAHFAGWCKNCCLVFDIGHCQDCQYGVDLGYCRDCLDCFCAFKSELCYECVRVEGCYNLFHAYRCKDCSFSACLQDCIGCSHCLGCINLRNKEYYLFNRKASPAEFENTWKAVFNGSFAAQCEVQDKFTEHSRKYPRRALHIVNCYNSSGDDLENCENVSDSYQCFEAKDSRYLHNCYFGVHNCCDVNNWGEQMEFCYELSGCGGRLGKTGIARCMFGTYIFYGGYDVLYSLNCLDKCQGLFGCCDLHKKQYCVLNKQYGKEEYERLVGRIIEHMMRTGEWGEFFPMSMSLFGYNESMAAEHFPLDENGARKLGAHWSSYEPGAPEAEKVLNAVDLPDNAGQADENIIRCALKCTSSGKLYRLNAQELLFYKKLGLALPRLHFYERHRRRFSRFNQRRLWLRQCAKTGKEIYSTYGPERPEIVYCNEAFEDALE